MGCGEMGEGEWNKVGEYYIKVVLSFNWSIIIL